MCWENLLTKQNFYHKIFKESEKHEAKKKWGGGENLKSIQKIFDIICKKKKKLKEKEKKEKKTIKQN